VDGFTLADGTVSVVGFVLAPDGDPDKVHIEVDPSVRIRWHSAETAAMLF
jgi:hypothetical protein